MSSVAISVVETANISRCRYCLIGVPEVGLVGSITSSFIIQEHQMAEVGHLESDVFPPVLVVHRGDPKPFLRLYSKGDVVAVISEIPVDPRLNSSIVGSVVDWAKSKDTEMLITLSGIAVQNRIDLDVPAVYGVGSSASMKKLISDAGLQIFEEGFITGFHAVVMKECLKRGVPNIILLAQAHLKYPDPGAAASLITALDRLIGLKLDTKRLLAQEDEIRLRMRELMQRTQQQMQQVEKGREQEIPPMYA